MIELFVNGQRRKLENITTVADVLQHLDVVTDQGGIAVAVNDEVVPREQWQTAVLKPGDHIEVIHAVQGG